MKTLEEALASYIKQNPDQMFRINTKQMLDDLDRDDNFKRLLNAGIEVLLNEAGLDTKKIAVASSVLTAMFQSGAIVGAAMERQEL